MADDEEEPKPAKRKRSKQVSKPVVVTLAVGLATAYFEYRTRTAKDTAEQAESKTDKGYETLAPLVRDLQEQVKVLAVQVDLLRQVALAKRGVARPMTWPNVVPADPVKELEKTPPPDLADVAAAAPPPESLE